MHAYIHVMVTIARALFDAKKPRACNAYVTSPKA